MQARQSLGINGVGMKLTFVVNQVYLDREARHYIVTLRMIVGQGDKMTITPENKRLIPMQMQMELTARIPETSNKVPRQLDLVVMELSNG